MKIIITGASSGIGAAFARILDQQGHKLILVSRNRDKLQGLQRTLKQKARIICLDLSQASNCLLLYRLTKNEDVDMLINNAGYGMFGPFHTTSLADEINMMNLNVRAVHILTKYFLRDFVRRDRGILLNVASAAGLLPGGPLMAAYYASKAYIVHLTKGIQGELRRQGSRVQVSLLCPGPVDTNFNRRAGVKFASHGISAHRAAAEALEGVMNGQDCVVPGLPFQLGTFLHRFLPERLVLAMTWWFQSVKLRRPDKL